VTVTSSGDVAAAGGQLALLFEDLFKKMNAELLTEAKKTLTKANRSTAFDAAANIRSDIITHAMESALSTGCWNIKRFRMDRKGATQVLCQRQGRHSTSQTADAQSECNRLEPSSKRSRQCTGSRQATVKLVESTRLTQRT
jgi:DNA-directed RNA polymerase III subunit RPC2